MPVEPPPTPWRFPSPLTARGEVVALGGDLEPATLLAGYRAGMFPMRLDGTRGPLAWWSPDPRGVIPLDGMHVSRSLRRSARRYEIRVDTAFAEVVAGCADRARPGGWITPRYAAAYRQLHHLGWAHSVEAWDGDELAGGLLGVAVGGLFCAESKFSRATDASKVALLGLVERLRAGSHPEARLLDVQWATPHLISLGCVEIPRSAYLAALPPALDVELPPAFAGRLGEAYAAPEGSR